MIAEEAPHRDYPNRHSPTDTARPASREPGFFRARRRVRIGAAITVVADAVSVGSDAGSIRHEVTVIVAPVLSTCPKNTPCSEQRHPAA